MVTSTRGKVHLTPWSHVWTSRDAFFKLGFKEELRFEEELGFKLNPQFQVRGARCVGQKGKQDKTNRLGSDPIWRIRFWVALGLRWVGIVWGWAGVA